MATEVKCPECSTLRPDPSKVCPACGAPPIREGDKAQPGNKRAHEEEVRTEDLEPYVTLRYIARLFKVLAVLMVLMLIGEVITGKKQGRTSDEDITLFDSTGIALQDSATVPLEYERAVAAGVGVEKKMIST